MSKLKTKKGDIIKIAKKQGSQDISKTYNQQKALVQNI